MVEVTCLSDAELQNKLNTLGFPPGPILPSTRKVYEKKLRQLLVSTPCAPPKKNRPGELSRARDDDGSEEFNATIILKRNITPSSEKSKGPKNNDSKTKDQKTEASKPEYLNLNYSYSFH
uniref:LEM domain containing 1 n=1 Tax=Ovis aries TaxID=9940 RepID=A0AC11EAX7_SHEEP